MSAVQVSASSVARHEQILSLLDLAVRLRRQGAGPAGLQAALQERLATLPRPVLQQTDLNAIAASLAVIPPHLVARAVNSLLLSQSALRSLSSPPSEKQPGHEWSPIPVHTAVTIGSEIPAAVGWLAEPWAAAGAITAITGRPKVGKTTFILDLLAAVLVGSPFLGRNTLHAPAVYLTEQQPSSFRASLARSGLLSHEHLAVLFWHETIALQWPAVAAVVAEQCRTRGARLLVVDTLSQWAGMRGDMENQAGEAFQALRPLQQIAGTGVAVVFLQHERKSGGDTADAGRGSSAFAGAVDTLVSFRRPSYFTPSLAGKASQDRSSTLRLLLTLSRFDTVPPELYIERLDGRYAVVGRAPDVAAQQARAAVLAALPRTEPDAVTIETLIHLTGVRRTALLRAIDGLLAVGQALRTGAGRRGSPYRYCLADSFLPAIE